MTVVKADAYGHGLKQIAALLMQSGTDVFGVANLTEARAIHSVGKGWPVVMLGARLPDEVELAVAEGVTPAISSLAEAKWFSRTAMRLNRATGVHIKVDTGMGRLGVAPEEARELAVRVSRLPDLKVEGLYTHYSSAEDDAEFSRAQRQRFEKVLSELAKEGIRVPLIHACQRCCWQRLWAMRLKLSEEGLRYSQSTTGIPKIRRAGPIPLPHKTSP